MASPTGGPRSGYIGGMFRSLGLQTDAALARHWGHLEDHGPWVKLTTPNVPGHELTNGIIFRARPEVGALDSDLALANTTFAGTGLRRVRLAWDTTEAHELPPPGSPWPSSPCRVLVLSRRQAPPARPGWKVLALEDDAAWEAALSVTRCVVSPSVGEAKRAQIDLHHRRVLGAFRDLCLADQGRFFGAWRGGLMVAVGGVYLAGSLARMQWLITLPEARRQGACQALLAASGHWALTEGRAERLILEVLEDNLAGRGAYQAAGFEATERQLWLWHTLPQAPAPA